MAGTDISWRFRGLREAQRAAARLDGQAEREIEQARDRLAQRLAGFVRTAGESSDRQSARAAATVRPGSGSQMVVAGPHPLLFGSEFGASGRFGWYGKPRFFHSPARQFRPHRGAGSYWFFRTIERHQADIDAEWRATSDAITRAWSA